MRNRAMDTERIFDSLMGLNAFAKAVNSTLNLGEVEELILEGIARLMNAGKVLILWLDETKTILTLQRFHGLDQMELQLKNFHNIKPFGHCIAHKGTVITMDDVLTDDDLQLQCQQMPLLSDMVFAPLEIKGEACGLLGISRDTPEFSTFELEIFCSLGSQAAIALENAHSYKKLDDAFLHTTEALAKIISSRAPHLGGHT
ncbi:MAG: GAF domain-containing protein [Desulforhopalus sp.]